jgi:hypothetical protein
MRKAISAILAISLATSATSQGLAADVSEISIGETYYVYNVVGDNDVVSVIDIDYSAKAVQVRHVGGGVEWVRAQDLMSRVESDAANTATNVGVAVGIMGLLYCASSPDACKK